MSGRFVVVGSLFAVSLMWPSEGAIHGDGLHWAILWLAAAAFGCWQILCSGHFTLSNSGSADCKPSAEGDWLNVLSRSAAFVIVAGVWGSTFYVFEIQADRRSALNIAFEWTSILAASVLFWQWPVSEFRQQFGRLVVGVTLGLAIMGILQHHVVWAERADWYLERMASVENWEQNGSGAAAAKQAEAELLAEQVPLTGNAAETFRRRLLDSTEAIGPFALANTLGGFLAAGLVLLIGFMFSVRTAAVTAAATDSSSLHFKSQCKILLLPMLWAMIVGYALVLTKSRTAWVATAVGIFCLLNGMRKKHVVSTSVSSPAVSLAVTGSAATDDQVGDISKSPDQSNRVFGRMVLLICFVAVGLLVAGVAAGSIDREVLLESPKSLRYRLMYWMGTLDLLADHALFGTGPGNFRNTYLRYKLPEASEQILDPHNLPLDIYCSAGVVGLIGLLLLLRTAFAGRSRSRTIEPKTELWVEPVQRRFHRGPFLLAAGLAFGLFAMWEWFNGADVISEFVKLPDGGFLVLMIPAGIVLAAMTMVSRLSVDCVVFQAAFAALLVHLLGAGAFQITSVGLMLMCLHRGSCDPSGGASETDSRVHRRVLNQGAELLLRPRFSRFVNRVGLVGFSLLTIVVATYGLIPARAAERALVAGRMAEASGRTKAAVSVLDDGIAADEFNVKLRQRKAELLAYSFMAKIAAQEDPAPGLDERIQELDRVIAACDDWGLADSTSYRQLVVKSRVLESLWKSQGQKAQLVSAIDLMTRVVDRYPTNAELLSRLALLQSAAGLETEAGATASDALRQDEMNRSWGHAELYLDDLLLDLLNQALKE